MKKDDVQFYPQKQPYFTNSYHKPVKKTPQLQENHHQQSKSSVKALQTKINYLEQQLSKLSQLLCEDVNNSNLVMKLSNQITQLKYHLSQKTSNNQQLSKQLMKSNQANNQLKHALQEMKNEIKSISQQIYRSKQHHNKTNFTQNNDFLKRQLQAVRQSFLTKQRQMNQKQKQLSNQIYSYQTQIRKMQQQNNIFKEQILRFTEISKQNKKSIQKAIQQKYKQSDQVLKVFQQQKFKYIQSINQLKDKLTQEKQRYLRLNDQNDGLKRQNKQLSNALKQINEQIIKYQKQNEKKYQQLENQLKLNRQYSQQISKLNIENSKLSHKLKESLQTIQQQSMSNQSLRKMIQSQSNSIYRQSQSHQLTLRVTKQQLSQTLNKLNQQIHKSEEQKKIWKNKQQYLNGQLSSVGVKIHKYELELMNKDITIQNQKQSIRMFEKLLEDQKKKHVQLINQLDQKYKNLKNAMESQNFNIQKKHQQNTFLIKVKEQLQYRISQLTSQRIPLLSRQIQTLQQKLKQADQSIVKKQLQIDTLKKQNKILHININEEIKMKNQLDHYLKQTQLRVKQAVYNSQLSNLKKSKLAIDNEAQVHFYKIQNSSLRSHIKSLQNQLVQLKSQHSIQKNKYQRMESQHQKLTTQSINLTEKINNLNQIISQIQRDTQIKSQKIYQLQNQIVSQNKIMQSFKYESNKQKNLLLDQVEKLRIQNSYHKSHVHKLMQQQQNKKHHFNFKNYSSQQSRFINSMKNKKSQYNQKQGSYLNSNRFSISNKLQMEDYIQQLKSQNQILVRRLERANRDIGKLKDCIEDKLQENQITSRSQSCAIQQAMWLIDIFHTQIVQYKKDMNTIRLQKKQLLSKIVELQSKLTKLQYENNRLNFQRQTIQKHNYQFDDYPINLESKYTKQNLFTNNNNEEIPQIRLKELEKSQSESFLKKNNSKNTSIELNKDDHIKQRQLKRVIFGTMRKQIMQMMKNEDQY